MNTCMTTYVSGRTGISTQYVVLGYKLRRPIKLENLPNAQHTSYRWATGEEIHAESADHLNTRVYFGEPLPRYPSTSHSAAAMNCTSPCVTLAAISVENCRRWLAQLLSISSFKSGS